MVIRAHDPRPNYRQVESCLTCPHVVDKGRYTTALLCNKHDSFYAEPTGICDDHPKVKTIVREVVKITENTVPEGFKLVAKTKRKTKKRRTKKKTSKKKAIDNDKEV